MSGPSAAGGLTEDQLAGLSRLSLDELNLLLDRESDLADGPLVEQFAEAVRRLVRIEPAEALRFAETALVIAGRSHDAAQLGRATRAKANALWYQGNLRESVKLFHEAVERFETAGALSEVGRTLSSCIQPLALLGEYSEAFRAAERARQIFLQTEDRWRAARLEINVANIHHRQDRFAEALASYQRAYEELLQHKDAEAITASLHNMAVCLIALNEFDNALNIYRRARDLSEKNEMPRVTAQADYNIAYLYFLRGDYQVALDRLRAARELCGQNGDRYHSALCDLDQSEIYLELNLAEEAALFAKQAQVQFEALNISFETGRALFNRAIASHLLDEPSTALALFREAAEVFVREGNQGWQALIGLYRGLVLLEAGNTEEAAGLCREAATYFAQSGLDRRSIVCSLILARVALASSDWTTAEEHCRLALRQLASVEAPVLSYQAHALLGQTRLARGDSRAAARLFLEARRAVESLRSSLQGEELKISFMKNRLEVYESLVGICLKRRGPGAAETAFGYLEEAKSRSLLESLFGRGAPRFWGGSGEHDDRARTLRQELNWYYRRIEIEETRPEGISTSAIHGLRQEAQRREKELERLFHADDAAAHRMPLHPARTVTLDQIRASLGPQTTLLEYFQVGSRYIAAVVTRDQLRLESLGAIPEVTASIRMLQFQLSRLRTREAEKAGSGHLRLEAVNSRLEELYRLLVAPVIRWCRGDHLLVVPHGALHCLPFHALADQSSHLIDRFAVSYAPSAGIYSVCQRRKGAPSGPALLMGVGNGRTNMSREIRAVAAVVQEPDVRLGRQATARVLRELGPASRLIHIATHGSFRSDNPLFSSVRLADSYLTVYDLLQMNLPVNLLTLSGCGTGLSVVAAGDELLGLTRGVLLAGVRSFLASLWNVDDRSTAQFMAGFYGQLENCCDLTVALQRAMTEFRRRHPDPFYWAPFVLVGKPTFGGD